MIGAPKVVVLHQLASFAARASSRGPILARVPLMGVLKPFFSSVDVTMAARDAGDNWSVLKLKCRWATKDPPLRLFLWCNNPAVCSHQQLSFLLPAVKCFLHYASSFSLFPALFSPEAPTCTPMTHHSLTLTGQNCILLEHKLGALSYPMGAQKNVRMAANNNQEEPRITGLHGICTLVLLTLRRCFSVLINSASVML